MDVNARRRYAARPALDAGARRMASDRMDDGRVTMASTHAAKNGWKPRRRRHRVSRVGEVGLGG